MKFPSIKGVAHDLKLEHDELRRIYSQDELADEDGNFGVDVRLQVSAADWTLHTGDPSYDTDHRGFWGAGFLPYGRTNLRELARDLISEARDQWANEHGLFNYAGAHS